MIRSCGDFCQCDITLGLRPGINDGGLEATTSAIRLGMAGLFAWFQLSEYPLLTDRTDV